MKVIKENINNTTIFIEALDESIEMIGETAQGRATQPTGVAKEAKEAKDFYNKVKSIIRHIAEDIGVELENINTPGCPKQMEIEFNLGLSTRIGPVWLSGSGDSALKVKMVWEIEKHEEAS